MKLEDDSTFTLLSEDAGSPRHKESLVEKNIKKVFKELNISETKPLKARELTNYLGFTVKGARLDIGTGAYQKYDNYKKKLERMYKEGALELYDKGQYYPNTQHSFWTPF